MPYGNKPRDTVRQCVFAGVEFLMRQDLDALVVACNTATSVAIEDLRRAYAIPIIGMEPAVKPALLLAQQSGSRVLVLATDMTLRETKFLRLVDRIDDEARVDHLSLQQLVTYAETEVFDPERIGRYLEAATAHLDLAAYGAVVLGCTHFPFYRAHLARLFAPGTALVDGNRGTVTNLCKHLGPLPPSPAPGAVRFFESGAAASPERFQRLLERYRNASGS